jgi:uncharacterized protein
LRNSMAECKGLQVVGVDYSPDKKNLGKILPSIRLDAKKPAILLYHTPTTLDYIQQAGIDMQLSGHTHNGQIFPFNILVRFFNPYVHGLHLDGDSCIYVSQGTAHWGPPMRLGSFNELTVLHLVPK